MDAVALPLLLGVWLFDVAALSPMLLFASTKRLLDGRPAGHRAVNYLLAATGYAVVHVLVAFAPGIATGNVGVGWLALSTLGMLLGSWIVLGVVAPRLGWDPAEPESWNGRRALGTVALGYVSFVVALGLFAAVGLLALFARYPG